MNPIPPNTNRLHHLEIENQGLRARVAELEDLLGNCIKTFGPPEVKHPPSGVIVLKHLSYQWAHLYGWGAVNSLLQKNMSLISEDCELQTIYARSLIDLQQYHLASSVLTHAITKDPMELAPRIVYLDLCRETGHHILALKQAEIVMKLISTAKIESIEADPLIISRLILCLIDLNQIDQAKRELEPALRNFPNDPNLLDLKERIERLEANL